MLHLNSIATPGRHRPANDKAATPTAAPKTIRVHIDFKTLRQAQLLDRLLKRISRQDLHYLMFRQPETDELLTVLGNVREPLKSISHIYEPREMAVVENKLSDDSLAQRKQTAKL